MDVDRASAIDGREVAVAYTVQPEDVGEGLTRIAARLYGDAGRWGEIYDANRTVIGHNPAVIRAGQQLVIPGLRTGRGPGGGGGARVYVVEPPDTPAGLAGIAARLYGDAGRHAELRAVNRGVVGEGPERLQAGQHLIVPP
jgi:nucleoid-associated protein YgaU